MENNKNVTRKKILEAACSEFALNGYEKGRIREIAANASVNLAAANYHFGSKAKLYYAVFEYLFPASSLEREESAGNPEEDLRRNMKAFLKNMGADNKKTFLRNQLFFRELRNPSPMFEDIFKTILEPRINGLGLLVAEISGVERDSKLYYILVFQILAQFFLYAECHSFTARFSGISGFPAEEDANLIVDEMLAGLESRKQNLL